MPMSILNQLTEQCRTLPELLGFLPDLLGFLPDLLGFSLSLLSRVDQVVPHIPHPLSPLLKCVGSLGLDLLSVHGPLLPSHQTQGGGV